MARGGTHTLAFAVCGSRFEGVCSYAVHSQYNARVVAAAKCAVSYSVKPCVVQVRRSIAPMHPALQRAFRRCFVCNVLGDS